MKLRKAACAVVAAVLVSGFCFADGIVVAPVQGLSKDFIRGADVSMAAQIEESGGAFYDTDGTKKDLFDILKKNGVNWIRLRLWNNPVNDMPVISGGKVVSNKGQRAGGGNNDIARDIEIAKRAKAAGFKVLLDFHYSDFWTDPSQQTKPAAWKNLTGKDLQKALYDFTKDSLAKMKDAGCLPDMVQIGNELNGGMLWPDGKTWKGENDKSVGGYDGFTKLLKQASKAVRDTDKNIKIVIHLATGCDNALYHSVFDEVTKAKVDYDVIGMSYYPYWHGPLAALSANMADVSKKYGKEIIIAENGALWTEEDGDAQGNVGQVYSDETNGYLPTVQGQATEVRDVINAVAQVPAGRGLGVFYWEPDWIPVAGAGWRTGEGDNWENQAMFDFKGKALESLSVFNRVYDTSAVSITPAGCDPLKIKIAPGDKKTKLPAKIKINYSDDSVRLTPVTWDAYDFSKETAERTFTVVGHIAGSDAVVKAEITVSNQINIVTDPSFESGKLGEWKLNGPGAACYIENNKSNARTGSWTYKYWLDKPFKSMLTRTFTGLANGNYTLSIWAMGGGGENTVKLFARGFSADAKQTKSAAIKNTGWKKWVQYKIENVPVTNGQCTVGIYLDTNAGNWGNFDDVELYLNK